MYREFFEWFVRVVEVPVGSGIGIQRGPERRQSGYSRWSCGRRVAWRQGKHRPPAGADLDEGEDVGGCRGESESAVQFSGDFPVAASLFPGLTDEIRVRQEF